MRYAIPLPCTAVSLLRHFRKDVVIICLLSYFSPGAMPDRAHLENGTLLNPHGFGWAVGWNMSRSMDAEYSVRGFLRAREEHPYLPALFHSRNAAGNSPVTRQNIHPFTVIQGNKVMTVAHNGYLFPHDGEESDSRIFARDILPRYDLDDEQDRALLEMRMGPNKAVILRPGKEVRILNRYQGILLPDGTWHSNSDYLGEQRPAGICPQCNEVTDQKPVCPSCESKAQARRALLTEGR
jgi:hypothetical protein